VSRQRRPSTQVAGATARRALEYASLSGSLNTRRISCAPTLMQAVPVPSNRTAEVPKEAPKLTEIKLIDYDFKKYGSSTDCRRLRDKWEREVK
jgi:hypothetical protein